MKRLALCLMLTVCQPAPAIEAVGDKVTLTAEDKETLKTCAQAGGCKVWSLDEIKMLLVMFREKLMDSGAGCRRNSI